MCCRSWSRLKRLRGRKIDKRSIILCIVGVLLILISIDRGDFYCKRWDAREFTDCENYEHMLSGAPVPFRHQLLIGLARVGEKLYAGPWLLYAISWGSSLYLLSKYSKNRAVIFGTFLVPMMFYIGLYSQLLSLALLEYSKKRLSKRTALARILSYLYPMTLMFVVFRRYPWLVISAPLLLTWMPSMWQYTVWSGYPYEAGIVLNGLILISPGLVWQWVKRGDIKRIGLYGVGLCTQMGRGSVYMFDELTEKDRVGWVELVWLVVLMAII